MIESQQEYESRKAFVAGMEAEIARQEQTLVGMHPLLQQAIRTGQASLLAEARAEVAWYEAECDGRHAKLPMDTVIDIGDVLTIARQASVLRLEDIAERAGLTPEHLTIYETNGYQDAPLAHCHAIATALGVLFHAEALTLRRPSETAPAVSPTAPVRRPA